MPGVTPCARPPLPHSCSDTDPRHVQEGPPEPLRWQLCTTCRVESASEAASSSFPAASGGQCEREVVVRHTERSGHTHASGRPFYPRLSLPLAARPLTPGCETLPLRGALEASLSLHWLSAAKLFFLLLRLYFFMVFFYFLLVSFSSALIFFLGLRTGLILCELSTWLESRRSLVDDWAASVIAFWKLIFSFWLE